MNIYTGYIQKSHSSLNFVTNSKKEGAHATSFSLSQSRSQGSFSRGQRLSSASRQRCSLSRQLRGHLIPEKTHGEKKTQPSDIDQFKASTCVILFLGTVRSLSNRKKMVSTLCCGYRFKKLFGSSHSSSFDEGYPRRDEYAISCKFKFMWRTIQYILRIRGDKFMLCSID